MNAPLSQAAAPTVGDTIWLSRTVRVPAGATLRAGDWEAADPVEVLGPATITMRGGSAEVSYPVAIWRAGEHRLEVPGPLLLATDGTVDSLGGETMTLRVGSVLPRAATDTSLRPQPRAEFISRPTTTPIPLLVLLLLAMLLIVPLHWWWRRRGRPAVRPPAPDPGAHAKPPLDRWADAGEARAVAGAATSRLRATLATRVPGAAPALDTEAVLAMLSAERPSWPLDELAEVLRALDQARFGAGTVPDAVELARRAADLEPRLVAEAA